MNHTIIGQFDNINLLPGMDWDMMGAFVKTKEGNKYVKQTDWILKDNASGLYVILSDKEFKEKNPLQVEIVGKDLLTPNEIKAVILGLTTMIEDLEAVKDKQDYNFTPEAITDMKDMYSAATSAKKKLEDVVNKGQAFHLAKYEEGDENEFLTKQS